MATRQSWWTWAAVDGGQNKQEDAVVIRDKHDVCGIRFPWQHAKASSGPRISMVLPNFRCVNDRGGLAICISISSMTPFFLLIVAAA